MSKLEEMVDELALKALDLEEKTGDEDSVRKVADALGTSSPTMEEAFMTAVRYRRAHRRGMRMIQSLDRGDGPIALPNKPVGDDVH